MKEPADAFEYLEMLREQNGKQIQRFNEAYRYISIKARKMGVPVSNSETVVASGNKCNNETHYTQTMDEGEHCTSNTTYHQVGDVMP